MRKCLLALLLLCGCRNDSHISVVRHFAELVLTGQLKDAYSQLSAPCQKQMSFDDFSDMFSTEAGLGQKALNDVRRAKTDSIDSKLWPEPNATMVGWYEAEVSPAKLTRAYILVHVETSGGVDKIDCCAVQSSPL